MRRKFENTLKGKFYRSRNGVILGVCRGIAEYFDFSLFWIRIIAIISLLFTGFWPTLILYFVAALLMKPEPVIPIHTDEEQEFYDSYVHSRKWATERVKQRSENLERRLRHLEHTVTSPEFDWEKRFTS